MTGPGFLQTAALPPDIQELLRRYMPTFTAENMVALGSTDHMRLIFLGPPDVEGRPVPRCAIDISYETAIGLSNSIREVAGRRPPEHRSSSEQGS
ncbi:MAG: hypothetical protein HYR63_23450 [Proteobacteria bacterium]|nr:hypothetical protein [Pseudomonadota bacterium]